MQQCVIYIFNRYYVVSQDLERFLWWANNQNVPVTLKRTLPGTISLPSDFSPHKDDKSTMSKETKLESELNSYDMNDEDDFFSGCPIPGKDCPVIILG